MGAVVRAHSLKRASLNGCRGRVVGLQGRRMRVDFGRPRGVKALQPKNLKYVFLPTARSPRKIPAAVRLRASRVAHTKRRLFEDASSSTSRRFEPRSPGEDAPAAVKRAHMMLEVAGDLQSPADRQAFVSVIQRVTDAVVMQAFVDLNILFLLRSFLAAARPASGTASEDHVPVAIDVLELLTRLPVTARLLKRCGANEEITGLYAERPATRSALKRLRLHLVQAQSKRNAARRSTAAASTAAPPGGGSGQAAGVCREGRAASARAAAPAKPSAVAAVAASGQGPEEMEMLAAALSAMAAAERAARAANVD